MKMSRRRRSVTTSISSRTRPKAPLRSSTGVAAAADMELPASAGSAATAAAAAAAEGAASAANGRRCRGGSQLLQLLAASGAAPV